MKKYVFYVFYFVLLVSQKSYSQTNSDKTLEELSKDYFTYLESEGFRPKIDDVGDVSFKFEGSTFWAIPYYSKVLSLSIFLSLDDNQRCTKGLMNMINDFNFNRTVDVARTYEDCKTIEIRSTSHLSNQDDWKYIFEPSIIWLNDSSDDFSKKYREFLNKK
tara:strand:+ start:258 stop:740 length:483 start_codon:yes stop_codon:yes gene_type:complete